MISQKLEIIRRLECQNQSVFLASYNIGSLTIYNARKQKDQLGLFMASGESVKGPFQVMDIETA
jgi:hypothetical protein